MPATKRTRTQKPQPPTEAHPAQTPQETAHTPEEMRAELRQLVNILTRFAPLPDRVAGQLRNQHTDERCRARGGDTQARLTFRGAMAWARTMGEYSTDPGFPPMPTRWFLDCLMELGLLMPGATTHAKPAVNTDLADAEAAADDLLSTVRRSVDHAVGSNDGWKAALRAALAPDPQLDARVSRLRGLADLLVTWLAAVDAPALVAFSVGDDTVTALRAAASTLNEAIANKPAPQQPDRDSPAVNTAEGRLQFAMVVVWQTLADARNKGTSGLQLNVTPTVLRALDQGSRKKKAEPAPADPTAAATSSGSKPTGT